MVDWSGVVDFLMHAATVRCVQLLVLWTVCSLVFSSALGRFLAGAPDWTPRPPRRKRS